MDSYIFDTHVSTQIKIQQSISYDTLLPTIADILMIIRFRDSAILNEIGVIHLISIEMIYTFLR